MTALPFRLVVYVQDNECHRPFSPFRVITGNNRDLKDVWMTSKFCEDFSKFNRCRCRRAISLPCSIATLEAFFYYCQHIYNGTNIYLTSPPEIMISLLLSTIAIVPFGYMTAKSPDLNTLPLKAFFVPEGSLKYYPERKKKSENEMNAKINVLLPLS